MTIACPECYSHNTSLNVPVRGKWMSRCKSCGFEWAEGTSIDTDDEGRVYRDELQRLSDASRIGFLTGALLGLRDRFDGETRDIIDEILEEAKTRYSIDTEESN